MANTIDTQEQQQPPTVGARPEAPEALKELDKKIDDASIACHEAVAAGNTELAEELKTQKNELIQLANEEAQKHGAKFDSSPYQVWVKVWNKTNRVMRNRGAWSKTDGWYDSPAVYDTSPGDYAYIHTGGNGVAGCDVRAYFGYDGGPDFSVWWVYHPGGFGYGLDGGVSSKTEVDGHSIDFYVYG
ncbi:hypothetical protein BJY04DRAFT_19506 [Aspergillus karnatakaensis]|uniref:uncharacterized protein n=1 Tax=Aspergillus karnatakaensis TaxID=1810916 RepID=UPI003CCCE697